MNYEPSPEELARAEAALAEEETLWRAGAIGNQRTPGHVPVPRAPRAASEVERGLALDEAITSARQLVGKLEAMRTGPITGNAIDELRAISEAVVAKALEAERADPRSA